MTRQNVHNLGRRAAQQPSVGSRPVPAKNDSNIDSHAEYGDYAAAFVSATTSFISSRRALDRTSAVYRVRASPSQAIALDDAAGVVYVADRDNGRIRFADIDSRLCPLQASPPVLRLSAGGVCARARSRSRARADFDAWQ